MNHNHPQNRNNRWRNLSLVLLSLLIVGGIVYMKQTSNAEKTWNSTPIHDTIYQQVAIPDTTLAPETVPAADTIPPYTLPDTVLGRDPRNPYEAGYEDGYAAGCDDGAVRTPNATYDESSSFRTASERQNYAKGYAEGYDKGYHDGENNRQFNIGN